MHVSLKTEIYLDFSIKNAGFVFTVEKCDFSVFTYNYSFCVQLRTPSQCRSRKNSSGVKLFRENDVILSTMCSTLFSGSLFSASGTSLPCALFLAGVKFSRLPHVLVCFFVVFDLLYAFVALSCQILDSGSLFIVATAHARVATMLSV